MDNSNFRILIVDDVAKNLQVVGSILKQEKYHVEFAINGFKALEWIEKNEFDLMLLDVMMPDMDGFETCRRIRANEKHQDLPIIFLTAKTDNESIVNGFEVGGQDYVSKPFDSRELLARVKTHLELKDSRSKLREVNAWLEQKVKERTIELQDANEKLLELDTAKGTFLNIISHEIRTPLNGIRGFTELLKDELESTELFDYVNYLDQSITRLERFSYNALNITALRLGHYPLDLEEVSLSDLFEKIIEDFHSQLTEKEISLDIEIDKNLLIQVDRKLFTNCLENVFENSIRYSPKGGKISIPAFMRQDNVLIEFIDEGAGFSKPALASLFHLFSPGEGHMDQNEGIGLAFSKIIMDAHSGDIVVSNLEASGAKVCVVLPG